MHRNLSVDPSVSLCLKKGFPSYSPSSTYSPNMSPLYSAATPVELSTRNPEVIKMGFYWITSSTLLGFFIKPGFAEVTVASGMAFTPGDWLKLLKICLRTSLVMAEAEKVEHWFSFCSHEWNVWTYTLNTNDDCQNGPTNQLFFQPLTFFLVVLLSERERGFWIKSLFFNHFQ